MPLVVPRLSSGASNSSTASSSSTTSTQDSLRRRPVQKNSKQQRCSARRHPLRNPDSDTEHGSVRVIPLRHLHNWFREFTDHRVDSEEPGSSEAGRPDLLPKVGSSLHHVVAHFSMDRNCEICKRTKITRVPCRKRTSSHAPRVENFLLTFQSPTTRFTRRSVSHKKVTSARLL